MRFTIAACLVCALLLCTLLTNVPGHNSVGARAAANTDPEPADFRKLAEIFALPGTPSIKGKKWVAVDTGSANFPTKLEGWLLQEDAKKIALIDWHGEIHELKKAAAGDKRPVVKEEKGGGFLLGNLAGVDHSVAWKVQAEDYAVSSKKFLADGLPKAQDRDGMPGAWNMAADRFGLANYVIDAARYAHIAHQLGQMEHAAQLYRQAELAYKKYADQYIGGGKKPELPAFVADRLASNLRNSAILGGHGSTSRKELQKRWEKVATIPYHDYRAEAKDMVKHYESLLGEDAVWKEPDAKELAKMTTEQKVSYWLYHLRDLAVGQWSDPGSCYVLGGDFGLIMPDKEQKQKPNAAVELKKLGIAALPQIIAHLDDDRPTRCKGHWRSYWPDGHYLLRYGDCCQQIFEAITGKTISTGGGYPLQAGKGKQCQEAAENWWQNYQKKGEKQVLIEDTAAGSGDSSGHASKLAEKYPEAALAPIIAGARASTEGRIRASLISVAGKLKDDKVAAFLVDEVKGPYVESRVRAAVLLAARGDAVGRKALGKEWQLVTDQKTDRWNHSWVIDELSVAMISCGDPGMLKLLEQTLSQHEINTRSEIIYRLQQADKDLKGKPLTAETVAAVEDTLARLLDDQDETSMSRGTIGGKWLQDPALCDLAAEAMAARWQQPKLFDIHGPFQLRERQRLGIKNEWLKKRGKEAIPVPPARQVTPAPGEQVEPLLKTVLDATTAAKRKQALEAVGKLGLPALQAVRKQLASLKPDHPAHADLQLLAGRLGLIVAETRFSSDSVQPADAFRRKVDGLKGSPITEAVFLELLKDTAASLPKGVRGVKIVMERIPDDSGVCLILTLIADQPPRPGLSPQLRHGSRVVVGEENFGGGSGVIAGFGGTQVGLADIDWSDLTKNLRTALATQPDVYLFVRVHCSEVR